MMEGLGSIRLGNKRSGSDYKPEVGEIIVNIDRPNVLCNPYVVNEKRPRAQAIEEFREVLEQEVRDRRGPRYEAVCEIAGHLVGGCDVILMCWCHPLPCHGDLIKATVEQLLKPNAKLPRKRDY